MILSVIVSGNRTTLCMTLQDDEFSVMYVLNLWCSVLLGCYQKQSCFVQCVHCH